MDIAKILAERQQNRRKSYEVPEWKEDGKCLVIYYEPWLAKDQKKLSRLHPKWMETYATDAFVDLIIMKAENKDGEKIFNLDHKPALMNEEAVVISRIAGVIMSSESVEAQEKN